MKKIKFIPFIILFVLLQYGCTNDSTSDLIDGSTVDEITYTNTVKAIIDNNCVVCHASTPINGAPMSLTTYENVKDAVLTRGLLDRISRAQGASGMMPNGGTRLPQEKINQINTWTSEGFQQ